MYSSSTPSPLFLVFFVFIFLFIFGQFPYSGSTRTAHLRCRLTSWLPGWPHPKSRPSYWAAYLIDIRVLDCSGGLAPPPAVQCHCVSPRQQWARAVRATQILQPPSHISSVTANIRTVLTSFMYKLLPYCHETWESILILKCCLAMFKCLFCHVRRPFPTLSPLLRQKHSLK